MCAHLNEETDHKPGLVMSLLKNKCPRCRRGDLFIEANPYKLGRFMKMPQECQVCGQPFDMEPGFYYGTGFVSYGLAVAVSVATLVAWWVIIGLSVSDNRFFWWMGINAVILIAIQPLLMRLSRSIWLYFFVYYSPNWRKGDVVRSERVNKDQMGNW
ncbi:DUF983 domain-containing protein [Flavihumibacter solisilvae]|uniref:DUF983 domain-containing protein n=1 Tax=Flavihumibacter solisilvae TaxID=1349421 RepID=A0A0C1L0M8_9BACT|nr:DUF983 domain-containing protein [Flavihumibacter solisilvae]KIC93126.1 hypothetical protein OI18_19090 [Flavihumibacter solisilvae]